MSSEIYDIKIDIAPDRAGVDEVSRGLQEIESRADKTRQAMAKSVKVDTADLSAAIQSIQGLSRTFGTETFQHSASSIGLLSSRALAFQEQLVGAVSEAKKLESELIGGTSRADQFQTQIAKISSNAKEAQVSLDSVSTHAQKVRSDISRAFESISVGKSVQVQTGIQFDTSSIQRYRAALVDLQRVEEDTQRVSGLSKGEAALLQSIIGPTVARARAQQDLNSLLAQGRITTQQYTQATKELAKAENQAAGAATSLAGVARSALLALGVSFSVKQVLELGDAYTNLQNKIRTVSASNEELESRTQDVFDIANKTRQSVDAVATVYSRTAAATKQLGLSQQELTQFTLSLNEAVALSGATSNEARQGLIQLSQGMALGVLRGQDLRSVMEELPVVADVIAKQFGVTRGELTKLAESGKISAGQIVEAFKNARVELAEKFAKSVPTIGQAFEVFRNNVEQFIGQLNAAVPISATFAKGIVGLSKNLGDLAGVVGILALAFSLKLVPSIKAVGVAVAANPLGLIALAASAALPLIDSFAQKVGSITDSVQDSSTPFRDYTANIRKTGEALQGLSGKDLLRQGIYIDQFGKTFDGVHRILREDVQKMVDDLEKLRGAQSKTVEDASKSFREEEEALNQAINGRERYIEVLKTERALREKGVSEKDISAARPQLEAQQDRLIALRKELDLLNELRAPQQAAVDLLNAASDARDHGKITFERYIGYLREVGRLQQDAEAKKNLSKGEAAAFDAVNQELTTTAQKLQDAESASKKAGAGGTFYAGIIADLKKKLQDLNNTRGLSQDQLRVRADVVGSFEDLNHQIAATQGLINAGGEDAKLYQAHLRDLQRQQRDLFETKGLDSEQKRVYLELTSQAKAYQDEVARLNELLVKFKGTPLEQKIVTKTIDVQRAQLATDRTSGFTEGEKSIYEEVRKPQEDYIKRLQDIRQAKIDLGLTTEEVARLEDEAAVAALGNATTVEAGFVKAFAKIREEARDMASVVQQTLDTLVNHTVDALTQVLTTGKFQFKAFAYSILTELTKIYLRLLIVQAIAAAIGGGAGAYGVAGGGGTALGNRLFGEETGAPPARAGGGPAEAKRTYLVGERGPELFTPNQGGKVTSNAQLESAVSAAPPVINNTIVNVTDPSEVPRAINSGQSDNAVINVLSRNRASVKKILG